MQIHDHFDGTAHCVECAGPCRLTGDELNVTRLIRWVFEQAAVTQQGWMWSFTVETLRDLGVDWSQFSRRARAAVVEAHEK